MDSIVKSDDYLEKFRRVGFFGLMREVLGLVDLEKEREELEQEYWKLSDNYDEMSKQLRLVEEENRVLREQLVQQVTELTAKLVSEKQRSREDQLRLLQPPNALSIFRKCNMEDWFLRYEVKAGVIVMTHNSKYYPFDVMLIPMYGIRLCDKHGLPANLMQNYQYEALPAGKYAQPFLCSQLTPYKMRVLFGTENTEGFYLQDPRKAQDVILEIWASIKETDNTNENREHIEHWCHANHAHAAYFGGGYIVTRVISFAKMLNSGQPGGCPERQAERVREECYAEYLEMYFHDGDWE